MWRVLLAGVLVAIAIGGVAAAHTYPQERYTYDICHRGSHGYLICTERPGTRRPPGADPGAIIAAVITLATAGLIVAWRRLRRDQALRLLALLLGAWALVLAIVPALYIELDGYLSHELSPWRLEEREITLLLGPIGAGFLVGAGVLVLARARRGGSALWLRIGAAFGAALPTALAVLVLSFSILNHQNYFPAD